MPADPMGHSVPGGNHSAGTSGRRVFFLDVAAFFLLLVTPYLNFTIHNGFVVEPANVAVMVMFAVVAGLLAVFVKTLPVPGLRLLVLTVMILVFADFQFVGSFAVLSVTAGAFLVLCFLPGAHRSLLVSVVFGAMVVATFVMQVFGDSGRHTTDLAAPTQADVAGDRELPLYVHIVLDGQIGLEGLNDEVLAQKAVKDEIRKFFVGNGFRIFGRAYSLYDLTKFSLSSAFNFEQRQNLNAFLSIGPEEKSYKLNKNRYFDDLSTKGYRLHVYQSTYMDFCDELERKITECLTYDILSVSSKNLTAVGDWERLQIVVSAYSDLLFLKKKAGAFYKRIRQLLDKSGIDIPRWQVEHVQRIGPLAVLPTIDRLISDISVAERGNMFFAHLLLPHEPYALTSSCGVRRPVLEWPVNGGAEETEFFNTPASRLASYEAYVSQVRCSLSLLDKLLEAMKRRDSLRDAIFIIHGDHGSRISQIVPSAKDRDRLSEQDYFDTFSTLYAVKAPGVMPGVDRRMRSINDLLAGSLTASGPDVTAAKGEGHFVYLRADSPSARKPLVCRLFPVAWIGRYDRFIPAPLRVWGDSSCKDFAGSLDAEVVKVPMPEIPGSNTK